MEVSGGLGREVPEPTDWLLLAQTLALALPFRERQLHSERDGEHVPAGRLPLPLALALSSLETLSALREVSFP
jgi:hypothetical protein